MSRNLVIGLVAGLIVIAALIYGVTKSSSPTTVNQYINNSTTTPTTVVNNPTPVTTPTQAGAPRVTSGISTVVVSNSTAALSAGVLPNGAQTTYWYEYGLTNNLGSKTTIQAIGSGFTALPTPVYITGLKASTNYFVSLKAKNSFGQVSSALTNFTTNASPATPGTAPTTQTTAASSVARTSANLSGSVNPNGFATTYWFEYGDSANLDHGTPVQSVGSERVATNVSVPTSTLKPLTKYYYRPNAQNQYGTTNGATMTFTTTGPAAPDIPVVNTIAPTKVATSSVTFNAKVNPSGASTDYWFVYSTNSDLSTSVSSTNHQTVTNTDQSLTAVSATATGLAHNTKYYFQAVASNSYGSTNGAIMSFTTKR